MGAPLLVALSLGLSVVIAAFAWLAGSLIERFNHDPRLRERVWTAALILPSLPPIAVTLLLTLTPAPVVTIAAPSITTIAPVATRGVTAPVSAAPVAVFDEDAAASVVLGLAGLLTLARMTALGLRARRLTSLMRDADAASPEVIGTVASIASGLGISPPTVIVSAAAPEALLAGLGRPHLLLPLSLARTVAGPAARAVIGHELAHLKRGDHRALWLEEALLVLLAANPLMVPLRARRAAAREEACDALALGDAALETRRAYAQSLIEALRDRAGPQASGGLTALTFTGAGRTTAMSRLKAILNPAPAADRGSRLLTFGVSGLIAVLAGAGSLAVAAEREAVFQIQPVPTAPVVLSASPAALVSSTDEPRIVDLGAGSRELLNGARLPEGLPVWALSPERIEVRTAGDGPGTVNFILPFTGSTPVTIDGRLMPAGFPASGVNGDAVARVDIVGDHVRYTLKPEAEVRRARRDAAVSAQVTESRLTPQQQARYRNLSATAYKEVCASSDPGDDGFCAGVIFSVLGRASQAGICPPTAVAAPDATGSDLGDFVDRGRREMAGMQPNADEGAHAFAGRALKRAYPCGAAQAEAFQAEVTTFLQSFVPLTVAVDIGGRPLSVQGDETLRVVLVDETGAVMNTHGANNSGSARASGPLRPLGMTITVEDFPGPGEAARTFTLTGEIRGPGRALLYVAEPVTLRLAPGARRVDLRPTLSFRPA